MAFIRKNLKKLGVLLDNISKFYYEQTMQLNLSKDRLNNYKSENTEQFKVHKNISNNLHSGEIILYKLKSYSPDYDECHLYITNERICIIHNVNSAEISYLNLIDLQCLSFRNKYVLNNNHFGLIEFISEKIYVISQSTGHISNSYGFFVRSNLFHVIKIIESIIWYYGNINQRIKNIFEKEKAQIPHEFRDFYFKDKITIQSKKPSKSIEFNQDLYLTYSFGKIVFKPYYESKIKIQYKHPNYLNVLEIIYLLSVYWKFKNNSLLDKEILLEIQKKMEKEQGELSENQIKIEISQEELDKLGKNRYFDGTIKTLIESELSKKLYKKYKNYLNKDEKILLFYKEKVFNEFTLLIVGLALIDITSFFLMMYLSWGFSILFVLFMPGLVFLPVAFMTSFRKCLFTSQKIIFKKLIRIGTTPYSNIESITYTNVKLVGKTEKICFELIKSMDSKSFLKNKSFTLSLVPKKLGLYDRMIELRDQYKNISEIF